MTRWPQSAADRVAVHMLGATPARRRPRIGLRAVEVAMVVVTVAALITVWRV
jgi:hypothetical protein